MNNWRKSIVSLLAVCFASFTFGQTKAVTLKIGDPAPELKVTWLKGTPVQSFEKDKLYVVEFWATWCGPCKAAMPHLSELAKQYADKVTFIGVDVWENGSDKKLYETFKPALTEFITGMGDKMAYNIAMDNNDQHMGNNWMKAAGLNGIPATFLIKESRIIWIGHPIKLDTTLLNVVAGDYNMESYAKEYYEDIAKGEAVMAPIVSLTNVVNEAITAKDFTKAMNEIEKARPTIDSTWQEWLESLKFSTLLEFDVPQALSFARDFIKKKPDWKSTIIAIILQKDSLPREAYKLASEYLNDFLTVPGSQPPVLYHEIAKCHFKMNDMPNAIEAEKKAIKLGEEAIVAGKFEGSVTKDTVANYKNALETYKAAKK